MASETILRRTFEYVVDVARLAIHVHMRPRQIEPGLRMIEMRGNPCVCRVTSLALFAELPHVRVDVTGSAILWRAFENIILMATNACHVDMFASEVEACLVVVKAHIHPLCRLVAGRAVSAQLSLVAIVCAMAGETIGGSPFEFVADMAVYASCRRVRVG